MMSTASPSQRPPPDDQAYLDKLKQLSKFIEPLRRMIAKIDSGDSVNDKKKEMNKIKNLLDIISDSNRRMPMETLLKCEQVLEKMDFNKIHSKAQVQEQLAPVAQMPTPSAITKMQEHNLGQPLVDAILNNMKKPFFNHTLHRTFGPAVAALTNTTYRIPSPPPKRRKLEPNPEIPEVLQGEIARLDQRFKVQLDPLHRMGSQTIQLICRLDDKDLPCVPPITIKVSGSYPNKPPQCYTDEDEYGASDFLRDIHKTFARNMGKLPNIYCVTSLLTTWEMSVRQACSKEVASIG
jgi:mediator of RNA polymerase II transcription subunit 15